MVRARGSVKKVRGWALLAPAIAVAELTFVSVEVGVAEVLGDRLGQPAAAAHPADQFGAGVDVWDVVVQVAQARALARMSS
jgi:hypothetical protein